MRSFRSLLGCIAALCCMAGSARADLITAPADFSGATNYAYWDYGCEYEYNCGSYLETNNYVYQFLDGATNSYILNVTGVPGTYFSYGEVDAYSQVDQTYDSPIDFDLYSNQNGVAGPVTLTFDTFGNAIVPATVAAFATDLYNYSPFTATVSAYDTQGNLLGATTFSSVENDNTLLNFGALTTYSAFVGVVDNSTLGGASDIASVVISTASTLDDGSSNYFGIGTVGVEFVPEPGTLAMMLLAIGLLRAWRKGFRDVHRGA